MKRWSRVLDLWARSNTLLLTIILILGLSSLAPAVHGQEKVENAYFSMKIPDTWTYTESSNPINQVVAAPDEFGNILVYDDDDDESLFDRVRDGGAVAMFTEDTTYNLKSSPLEAYVKYIIDEEGNNWNLSSMDNGTIGTQNSVKISENGTNESANLRKVQYLVLDEEGPYILQYVANSKDYDKYLPEFEQMVKSFEFVG